MLGSQDLFVDPTLFPYCLLDYPLDVDHCFQSDQYIDPFLAFAADDRWNVDHNHYLILDQFLDHGLRLDQFLDQVLALVWDRCLNFDLKHFLLPVYLLLLLVLAVVAGDPAVVVVVAAVAAVEFAFLMVFVFESR